MEGYHFTVVTDIEAVEKSEAPDRTISPIQLCDVDIVHQKVY